MGNDTKAVRRATLAKVVWPAWVAGMMALATLDPIFHAMESNWIRKDQLLKVSRESPQSVLYETKVTDILRRDLIDMLKEAEGEGSEASLDH